MTVAALERSRRLVDVDIASDLPFVALVNAEKGVAMRMAACNFEERLTLHGHAGFILWQRYSRIRSCQRCKGRKT